MNEANPLTPEELQALTDDLQAVLTKHGAEMGVTSTINLLKSAQSVEETNVEETNVEETNNDGENKADTKTEKSS